MMRGIEERREKKKKKGRWARYNLFFKVGGKEVGSKKRKKIDQSPL